MPFSSSGEAEPVNRNGTAGSWDWCKKRLLGRSGLGLVDPHFLVQMGPSAACAWARVYQRSTQDIGGRCAYCVEGSANGAWAGRTGIVRLGCYRRSASGTLRLPSVTPHWIPIERLLALNLPRTIERGERLSVGMSETGGS